MNALEQHYGFADLTPSLESLLMAHTDLKQARGHQNQELQHLKRLGEELASLRREIQRTGSSRKLAGALESIEPGSITSKIPLTGFTQYPSHSCDQIALEAINDKLQSISKGLFEMMVGNVHQLMAKIWDVFGSDKQTERAYIAVLGNIDETRSAIAELMRMAKIEPLEAARWLEESDDVQQARVAKTAANNALLERLLSNPHLVADYVVFCKALNKNLKVLEDHAEQFVEGLVQVRGLLSDDQQETLAKKLESITTPEIALVELIKGIDKGSFKINRGPNRLLVDELNQIIDLCEADTTKPAQRPIQDWLPPVAKRFGTVYGTLSDSIQDINKSIGNVYKITQELDHDIGRVKNQSGLNAERLTTAFSTAGRNIQEQLQVYARVLTLGNLLQRTLQRYVGCEMADQSRTLTELSRHIWENADYQKKLEKIMSNLKGRLKLVREIEQLNLNA